MAPSDDKVPQATSEETAEPKFGDAVDMNTFNQILEMDEPDDHEFSHSIVYGFFDQAKDTFVSMDAALKDKDLMKLSSLGHFLKGSSATLGLVKIRDGCENIQQYGKNENVDGSPELDSELCLKRIKEALKEVKTDYRDVESKLRKYYGEEEAPDQTEDS